MSLNQNDTKGEVKKPMTELAFTGSNKGKLIIPISLQKQIEYLHKKVGPIEWCGVLLFKRLEGNINNPKELVLQADHVFLMDIGRETYTEADLDASSVVDMWGMVNDDYEYRQGLIHTHHTMGAYFSGTDKQELQDNAPMHNYYLSLIVNFKGDWVAKVAYVAKKTMNSTLSFKDAEDVNINEVTTKEESMLVTFDLEIIKQEEELVVSDFFRGRYSSIQEADEQRAAAKALAAESTVGHYSAARSQYNPESPIYTGGTTSSNRIGFNRNEEVDESLADTASASDFREEGSTIITNTGKLHLKGKAFTPATQMEMEIAVGILAWFNDGADIYGEMAPYGKFQTISRAMEFFETYFSGDNIHQLDYWINQMQVCMGHHFAGKFSPRAISRCGMEATASYKSEVGLSIYAIFDSYELWTAINNASESKAFRKEKLEKKEKTYARVKRNTRE